MNCCDAMLPFCRRRFKLSRRWRCVSFRSRVLLCFFVLSAVALIMTSSYSATVRRQATTTTTTTTTELPNTSPTRFLKQTVPLSPQLENLTKIIQLRTLAADSAGTPHGGYPLKVCSDSPTGSDSRVWPENVEETFRWQPMVRGSDAVYLFAAHFDRRWYPTPAVVVIGLADYNARLSSVPKYCRLWYRNDVTKTPHVTPVHSRYSAETHELRYSPSFYTCFVRDNDVIPYAVSLVNDPCDKSPRQNLLKVLTSSDYDVTSQVNFTVCVTPFNYRYDNVRQLVEMIEVNRMFGAQHFIFYDYSSGPNVTRYLDEFYRKYLDIVTVVPWPLPMPVDVWPPNPQVTPEVHYFGQVAALNDCLYRCIVRRSTFSVFTDLDEIIVPRRRDSWSAMLDDVTTHWQRTKQRSGTESLLPGSYVFRNTFFRTDWTQDQQFAERGDEYQLLDTVLTTEREEKVFEWPSRSKYITWSNAAVMVGVHSVEHAVPDVDAVMVDVPDALLHHYRQWKGEDDPVNPPTRIIDRHMHRYADKIARRTAAVHRDMMVT